MRRLFVVHVALVALALAVMAVHVRTMGLIQQGEGRGWDGQAYAWLLEGQFPERTTSARLRLGVVALNMPAYAVVKDAVKAFAFMNYVYCGVLVLALVLIAGAYGASTLIKTYLVGTASLSIATFQLFAYYPVQVDLGAYAVMAVAVCCIVRGWRVGAVAAMLLSVISREFAVAVVLFGIHRDLRLRVPLWKAALSYLPPLVLYFAWRQFVGIDQTNASLLSLTAIPRNLTLWQDPLFAAWFVYFTVTVFGGISMIVVADAARAARRFRAEPEWLTYAAVVMAAAVVGNADIWRYLAYLVPVAPAALAWCASQWSASERVWFLTLGAVGTWITQAPFQAMDLDRYFRDWFPYYISSSIIRDTTPDLWPVWAWRFLACAVAIWLMAAFRPVRSVPMRPTGAFPI